MNLNFGVEVTVDSKTGRPISVYFQVRRGRVHETREFADGAACADYDRTGALLGIELLAPCRVSIVDQLAANEPETVRRDAKRFIKNAGPRQFIAA
jgi:hypothetical protein